MANKYKLTPAARNDIKQIWHYSVETWGEKQATVYMTQLETRFDELAENPLLGRARPDTDGHSDPAHLATFAFWRA